VPSGRAAVGNGYLAKWRRWREIAQGFGQNAATDDGGENQFGRRERPSDDAPAPAIGGVLSAAALSAEHRDHHAQRGLDDARLPRKPGDRGGVRRQTSEQRGAAPIPFAIAALRQQLRECRTIGESIARLERVAEGADGGQPAIVKARLRTAARHSASAGKESPASRRAAARGIIPCRRSAAIARLTARLDHQNVAIARPAPLAIRGAGDRLNDCGRTACVTIALPSPGDRRR
jgi:hypothetical protein